MKTPAKQRISRNPHGARTAKRRSAPRKPHLHTGAATRPLGGGLSRPAAPLPVRPADPRRRTSSHDKPAARPFVTYRPSALTMHLGPAFAGRAPARARAQAAATHFDKAAQLKRALFGDHAERLANLHNRGADDE